MLVAVAVNAPYLAFITAITTTAVDAFVLLATSAIVVLRIVLIYRRHCCIIISPR